MVFLFFWLPAAVLLSSPIVLCLGHRRGRTLHRSVIPCLPTGRYSSFFEPYKAFKSLLVCLIFLVWLIYFFEPYKAYKAFKILLVCLLCLVWLTKLLKHYLTPLNRILNPQIIFIINNLHFY
jgi:hypothetical protein